MPRALSSVRLDEHATCKYVLFIEGISTAWTNDTSGALRGSGVGTWIYDSEVDRGEVSGTRTVREGLVLPDAVRFSIDPKTGWFDPNPMSFQILDLEDELADLFATEGAETSILGERIPPGTTALGTSVATIGGSGTINPRGRYIGIEKIGPSGQRRQWPAIPYDLVGYDHPVQASATPPDGIAPVLISDRPIEFAGRMVSLYRIYKDPDAVSDDYTAYYTLAEAEAAGDRVWWGVLRDAGNISGNKMWTIDCHGPDALLRRQLGTRAPARWMRISAQLDLSDAENQVAIGFGSYGLAGASVLTVYDAAVFNTGAGHQFTAVNAYDRVSTATTLNGWIEDALAGTDTNETAAGAFATWADAGGSPTPDAGVTSEGVFFVRREAHAPLDDLTFGEMYIVMHERVWRTLGWQPETQSNSADLSPSDLAQAEFRWLEAGEKLNLPNFSTTRVVPAPGYVLGIFRTIAPGAKIEDIAQYDNDGGPRLYYPLHTSEVFVLDRRGYQVVRLQGEDANSLYLEGQNTAARTVGAVINGIDCTHSRWFALRGKYLTQNPDGSLGDEEDITQVVAASWIQGAQYGVVSEGTEVQPALLIEKFLDPRSFGFDNKPLTHDWAGKVAGEGGIEIAPLSSYHYYLDDRPYEEADTLFSQIVLSTGSSDGWDDAIDDGASIAAGDNTHAGAPLFAGDYEIADLGLGVPWQLVADPTEIRAAFDTVPGGYNGDYNRLRLAYIGAYSSDDLLQSLTRPRLLCGSLAGKRYSLFRLGPIADGDVDLEIDADACTGTINDPVTTIPSQQLRATGQIDAAVLEYRWSPEDGSPQLKQRGQALDSGASRRTGDFVETFSDHGLCPMPWFGSGEVVDITGIHDWRPHFKQLWQREAPEFFARRHFMASFKLARTLGQDAMPGSTVRVTSPWLVNPSGGYGVTGFTGRVISVSHSFEDETTTADVLVFAGGATRHYAPVVRIRRVTTTTLEWYPDFLGHGNDELLDGTGFSAGDAVTLYQRSGDTYTSVGTDTIVSVDTTTRTMVVTTGFTGWLRDRDHYLTLSPYSSQATDSTTRTRFGVVADDDDTIGDGTTPAPNFAG